MTVAAVIVTHNRVALLQACLASLRVQDHSVNEVIVVNNGSTDGTGEWLDGQTNLTKIHQSNTGSSGGQCSGIKAAYEKGHDWVWRMDGEHRGGILRAVTDP